MKQRKCAGRDGATENHHRLYQEEEKEGVRVREGRWWKGRWWKGEVVEGGGGGRRRWKEGEEKTWRRISIKEKEGRGWK